MANINKEKDKKTNTFYVNPNTAEGYDVNGVTYPEASYPDGIEVPDKLVTVKGDINYHILDAVNLDWDDVQIPWAAKVTEWASNPFDDTSDYHYHKPEDGSWTSGHINESEEVVDILNYLLYRTVLHDDYLKRNDEKDKKPAHIRMVNNRTDWYENIDVSVLPEDEKKEITVTEKYDDATISFIDAKGKATKTPQCDTDYVTCEIDGSCDKGSESIFSGLKLSPKDDTKLNINFVAGVEGGVQELHVFYYPKDVWHKEVDRILMCTFINNDEEIKLYNIVGDSYSGSDWVEAVFDLSGYNEITEMSVSLGPDAKSVTHIINKIEFYVEQTVEIPDPDSLIGDNDNETILPSDERYTVKDTDLKVYLYPYLVANGWSNPEDEVSADTIPFKNHEGIEITTGGVVVSDLGYAIQRGLIFTPENVYDHILEGGENFDIYRVETESDGDKITFTSSNSAVLDGFVQPVADKIIAQEDEGEVVEYLYKLPVYAAKCSSADKYTYTSLDVLKYLFTNKIVGINNAGYTPITYRSTHPEIDIDKVSVKMSVAIETTDTYQSDIFSRYVNVYKGDNQLYDLKISKSVVNSTETVKDSYNNDVTRNIYTTNVPIFKEENSYKYEITYSAEFDETYDAEHTGSDEEVLKQSHMHPYFAIKDSSLLPTQALTLYNNAIAPFINNYAEVQANPTTANVVLFSDSEYGIIKYERGKYIYYAPVSESTIDKDVTLYMLMYYPANDVSNNRLLKPLWGELKMHLQSIQENSIVFADSCEHTEGSDYGIYTCSADKGSFNISSIITTSLDTAGSDLLPLTISALGYANDDYSTHTRKYNYSDPSEESELKKTRFGYSIISTYAYNYSVALDEDDEPIVTDSTSIPANSKYTFDASLSTISIPEITLTDCVSLDTTDNTFTVNGSTALYAKQNGLLVNNLLDEDVDADRDYFYIVYNVECPADYSGDSGVMREACSAKLLIKVKRADYGEISISLTDSSLTVRNEVNLTDLLSDASKEIFTKFDGDYKWDVTNYCDGIYDIDGNPIDVLHDADGEGKFAILGENAEFSDNETICITKMQTVERAGSVGNIYYTIINYSGDSVRIYIVLTFGNTSMYNSAECNWNKVTVNKLSAAQSDITLVSYTNGDEDNYQILPSTKEKCPIIAPNTYAYIYILSDFYGDQDNGATIDLDDILKHDLNDVFGTTYAFTANGNTYNYTYETGMHTVSFDNGDDYSVLQTVPITLSVAANAYFAPCTVTGYLSYTFN